ncbi:hypothetical protein PA598K_05789 [Paenibacillus sp. 598K]|nr:hypothetical protein PA598K_05789 [Paenibacillus sp. 598K]
MIDLVHSVWYNIPNLTGGFDDMKKLSCLFAGAIIGAAVTLTKCVYETEIAFEAVTPHST